MNGYGAVENRPKGGIVAGTIVGVALLVAIAGGIIYYQTSERRRIDAMDYEMLNAEHDALLAVAAPLKRLEEAAVPETLPPDYERLLSEARAAYERHATPPRRSTALPSGRPWPAQFAAADELVKTSFDRFGQLSYYIDRRAKTKPSKVSGTLAADNDIQNVAQMATDPLHELDALLQRMQTQRDDREWDYGPMPRKRIDS